jgi:hypothetical protein
MKAVGNSPKITCTSSDCRNNLHCFKATRQMKSEGKTGACRSCGAELIDWHRIHQRDLLDVEYTVQALQLELIRHKFWHVEIDARAVNHAKRKGFEGMRLAIESRIKKSVGPANPTFDGRQTPMEGSGNVIYYAQHATASCCRKCLEYWHGIRQGKSLAKKEIDYLAELVLVYIRERLPDLTETGEDVSLGRQNVGERAVRRTI